MIEETFQDLGGFLIWLTGGGGALLVSFLAERWDWFQSQTPKVKQFLMIVIPSLLGIGALTITTFVPPEIIAQASPYFMVVVTVITYVLGTKAFHIVDKNNSAQ
jgi:hypothetical protein